MERDKWYYRISVIFFILAAGIHAVGYITNYLYMAGWLMWVPAIILMVIVVVNIVKDKYIVNKYLSRRKILLSTECIICCITIVYVIFNVIYNSYLLRNGGGQYTEGVYYLINMKESGKLPKRIMEGFCLRNTGCLPDISFCCMHWRYFSSGSSAWKRNNENFVYLLSVFRKYDMIMKWCRKHFGNGEQS